MRSVSFRIVPYNSVSFRATLLHTAHFLWKSWEETHSQASGAPSHSEDCLAWLIVSLADLLHLCLTSRFRNNTIDTPPLFTEFEKCPWAPSPTSGSTKTRRGPIFSLTPNWNVETQVNVNDSNGSWFFAKESASKGQKRLTWASKHVVIRISFGMGKAKKTYTRMQFHVWSALRSLRIRTPWLKVGKCPVKASQCDSHFCCVQCAAHRNLKKCGRSEQICKIDQNVYLRQRLRIDASSAMVKSKSSKANQWRTSTFHGPSINMSPQLENTIIYASTYNIQNTHTHIGYVTLDLVDRILYPNSQK